MNPQTREEAASEYAGKCNCGECGRCYSSLSFLAGTEWKNKQLLDEIQQLKSKLAVAKKALEKIDEHTRGYGYQAETARQALKEIGEG